MEKRILEKMDKDFQDFYESMINSYYSNVSVSTQLADLLVRDDTAINSYIKVGRKFWFFDGSKGWRKLMVTYTRSGVMFFVFQDELETEHAWFTGSFNCWSLHAAEIYPDEIGILLSKKYPEAREDIPRICKQCKWIDFEGKITPEVIWDSDNS